MPTSPASQRPLLTSTQIVLVGLVPRRECVHSQSRHSLLASIDLDAYIGVGANVPVSQQFKVTFPLANINLHPAVGPYHLL
jgi:hypothetical protein